MFGVILAEVLTTALKTSPPQDQANSEALPSGLTS